MAKLRVIAIPARFQVPELTDGHKKLAAFAKENADQLVFLLGISEMDGYTAENPLTFNQRSSIVRASLPAEWEPVILPLPDCRTNEEWSAHIDGLLSTSFPPANYTITLLGGRDSFTDAYKGKYEVKRFEVCPPITTAGRQDRAAIKETNSPDFYRGQIYALQRQFPHAYPTVDVAFVRPCTDKSAWEVGGAEAMHETLLIQRADNGRWCFPGGFVDPTDQTMEAAGRREMMEELGMHSESPFEYVCTHRIDDFRYRGSRDKVITTFFVAPFSWGAPTINYAEVQDYKWVKVDANLPTHVADTHQPLAEALWDWALARRPSEQEKIH